MRVRDSPFKVGDLVESRSFMSGYRGSWFRSKVKNASWRNGQIGYYLEYLDFPDEKKTWTKLYQKPRNHSNRYSKQSEFEIMLRPRFPPVFRESQMPDVSAISEVVVIVNDAWKVGDLVDWWKDECYWSGKITRTLEDGKLQLDLFPPPLGEGFSYEVCCKDLRPSLNWSPETGWTVPTPTDSDNSQQCARIINPVNRGSTPSSKVCTAGEEERDGVEGIVGASHATSTPSSEEGTASKETDGVESIAGASHATSSPRSKERTDGEERDRVEGMGGAAHATSTPSSKVHTDGEERDGVEAMSGAAHATSTPSSKEFATGEERDGVQGIAGASKSSVPSHASSCSSKPSDRLDDTEKKTTGTDMDVDMENGGTGKTGCSDDPSSLVKAVITTENGGTTLEKGGNGKTSCSDGSSPLVKAVLTTENGETAPEEDAADDGRSSKKRRTDSNIPQNSSYSDSIGASILDLEELVQRVKWMKSLLEIGMSPSNTRRPPWKFLGHLASSAPKTTGFCFSGRTAECTDAQFHTLTVGYGCRIRNIKDETTELNPTEENVPLLFPWHGVGWRISRPAVTN
ncbi:hypothetical protein TIFTF001_022615 [Ficus carica]|uniref:Agenet domain-containing protein n=1 Tax=Ficus carica TaxID=3494 RepID=A0AA88DCZ7_FICCA|nr:hypothetical protein TIFTF001_022615 [Ficus carica]